MSNLSKKIAVVGLGNTLRRDDGIGIKVLEALLNFHRKSGVDYLDFGVTSIDLLNKIKDYDTVLLIDGINAGDLRPGELVIFELSDMGHSVNEATVSTHELGLKDFFELYVKFGIMTKVYVAGIQVQDVAHGERLSGPLGDSKDGIVRQISSFIEKLCDDKPSKIVQRGKRPAL